jgi:hypothetical protein
MTKFLNAEQVKTFLAQFPYKLFPVLIDGFEQTVEDKHLAIARAQIRRERRAVKHLRAQVAGGYPFRQPDPLRINLLIVPSTRGERRRAQLGRS